MNGPAGILGRRGNELNIGHRWDCDVIDYARGIPDKLRESRCSISGEVGVMGISVLARPPGVPRVDQPGAVVFDDIRGDTGDGRL